MTIDKPKGIFMKKETKNILVATTAGVAALVLVLFGVKQCSDKKDARSDLEQARIEAENTSKRADMLENNAAKLADFADSTQNVCDDLRKEIAVRDSTIAELRDSLSVTSKQLDSCLNCKQNNKKRTAKKSATARPARTSTTVAVKPVQNATPVAGETTTTVIVPEDANKAINATGVTIGSGAHDNTVNINNGTINNYYTPVDTVKKDVKKVTVQRVKCVTDEIVRCK